MISDEPRECGRQYLRPGYREAALRDRIVRCDLPAGHEGDHEETETGSRWPAPAEPTAEKQARDEADLADINRRVAAEQNVIDKARAWRAALPWQTGVPRDKHAGRLADTQDALCTAVDGLPADSHVAPTNSQTWEQAAAEGERRIAASAPLIGALVDGTFLPGPLAMRAETPAVDGLPGEREGGA